MEREKDKETNVPEERQREREGIRSDKEIWAERNGARYRKIEEN